MEFDPRQDRAMRRPVQIILGNRKLPSIVFGTAFAGALSDSSCSLHDLAMRVFYITEPLRGPDLIIGYLTLLRRENSTPCLGTRETHGAEFCSFSLLPGRQQKATIQSVLGHDFAPRIGVRVSPDSHPAH